MGTKWLTAMLVAASLLCAEGAFGAPLILAQPAAQSAFVGDASVKFEVFATGDSPTFQWQVRLAGGGGDTDLVEGPDVSGTQTPVLVLGNPGAALDGNRYRCVITDATGFTRTARTKLAVFPAPTIFPIVTVTPGSIAANSAAPVSVQITGLNLAEAVVVDRVLDANGNGQADFGEPIVSSFVVTDGLVTSFGGVHNQAVPGDDDGAADGQITTTLSLPQSPEAGRTSGAYLVRVSSAEGTFRPVVQPLAVTQPSYGQAVSGHVTAGGMAAPGAVVILLQQTTGGDQLYVASTVADTAGNYNLSAPTGSYRVIAARLGCTFSFAAAPAIQLNAGDALTAVDPALTPATSTIEGQVVDSLGEALAGVQIFAQSQGGYVTLCTTDTNGVYTAAATPDLWELDASDLSAVLHGCVIPQALLNADTTAGIVADLDLTLPRATALVYGTLLDNVGNPLPGVRIDTSDAQNSSSGITGAAGEYFIGIIGGPAAGGGIWQVSIDTQSPAFAGYFPPPGQNFVPLIDTATQINFVTSIATPYQLWQLTYFDGWQLADPGISGPLATPAGDGIANLMKYAFNLVPFLDGHPFLPRPVYAGGNLTLTFQAIRSDVTYTTQVSTDLQSWTTAGINVNVVGQQVTATYPTTGLPKAFMRLQVTQP